MPLADSPTLDQPYLTGNDKKANQLGMPFGTASSRLRKTILFWVLQRHNENICFQCDKEITSCEELSIEHKIAWLDNDPTLFWDIDNIAFSHLKCNVGAAKRTSTIGRIQAGIKKRKIGPEDTAWCTECQDFLGVSEFSPNPSNWNGLSHQCKECRSMLRSPGKYTRQVII